MCNVKAKKSIINIAIHHDGKLLLNMAKIGVSLSGMELTLPATYVPSMMPTKIANIVDELNKSSVFGIFSNIISLTFDDPSSVVKKCDLPKSKVIVLTILEISLVGEYHSSFRPSSLVLY